MRYAAAWTRPKAAGPLDGRTEFTVSAQLASYEAAELERTPEGARAKELGEALREAVVIASAPAEERNPFRLRQLVARALVLAAFEGRGVRAWTEETPS